jgi:hypothetical protein
MWHEQPHRLALLELVTRGTLKRRSTQKEAFDDLLRLGWVHRTGRRDVVAIDEARRADLERTLDRAWPVWRDARDALEALALTPDEQGWRALVEQMRLADVDVERMPERLNRRTALAALAAHSKAPLTQRHREALGDTLLTRDGIVRMRACPGVRISRGDQSYDATDLAALLGEVVVSERALRDATRIAGSPRALLTVENVGAYVDLVAPEGWLVTHVPGWNTATLRLLVDQLAQVRWVHFGDLDPNGLRIVRHLRTIRPNVEWAMPPFWEDWVPARCRETDWRGLDVSDAPPLVRRLAENGWWLEQELVAVDPRLAEALERA